MEKIIVVVSCHKKDYFLTRTCVASIKYFHPEAEVYLLKDYLSGYFDSQELEQAFQVQVLDMGGTQKYGWGAAKVHFILSNKFVGQRVFIIDSDTVFAGKFLANLYQRTTGIDFVVDADFYQSPYEGNVPLHYYKFDDIKKFDPNFIFPGYVFNTGHLLITTGKIPADRIEPFFDASIYPYYKRRDILPQVDQSILNYLLPRMSQDGLIKLAPESIMAWSDGPQSKAIELAKLKQGLAYPFLIHWAGVLRISHFAKMTRPDILFFFEDYYYSKVPLGEVKKWARRALAASDYHLRGFYRKAIKPLIKK